MKQIFTYFKNNFTTHLKSKKSKFKGVRYAFTLAEVLITLGIIGVVATITLPTLIQNHQKQTYITALKKAYSNLQNTFAQMAVDEGVTDWNYINCGYIDTNKDPVSNTNRCINSIAKQLNIINTKYVTEDCNSDWCKSFSDEKYASMFITDDNIVYFLGDFPVSNVYIDINGIKGPNQWGRDKFRFSVKISKNKIEPWGLLNYQTYCTPEKLKQNETNGQYCTAKVLIEGKMDY